VAGFGLYWDLNSATKESGKLTMLFDGTYIDTEESFEVDICF